MLAVVIVKRLLMGVIVVVQKSMNSFNTKVNIHQLKRVNTYFICNFFAIMIRVALLFLAKIM